MTNRRSTRDVGVNRAALTAGLTEKGGTNPVPSQITTRPPPPPPPMTPPVQQPSALSTSNNRLR
jgi:hypothetical protein